MLTRLLRQTLPVAASVGFAAVASLGCAASVASATRTPGAPATATPGWRIVQFLPGAAAGGLSAPGARDAWLAGDACGTDSLCDRAFVRHWDGTSWRAISLPTAVTVTAGETRVSAVTASSASNAWVFDQRSMKSADYTTALHWTGNGWAAPARLAADIDTAVAPSAGDAWAFGAPAGDARGGYIAHFTGQTWSHASFPVQVQAVSALSAGDIWVGGTASDGPDGSVIIEHWNGKAWRETPLPGLGISLRSWIGLSVTAVRPRDAWAVVTALTGHTRASYLLHWNGKAWTRVAFSCPGSAISPVAADGHGGVWLATAPDTGGTIWFCHDANGQWTKTATPKRAGQQPAIDNLAWIPGTTSLWATGGFDADAGEAILKYGP